LGQEIDNEDWPAFQWKILVEPSDATGKSVQHLFWVYSDEYGSVKNIAVLCQAFIRKFRPDSVVGLTWADYCSKLRVGEFSGGWMVVSRDEQRFGNCDDELEKATKEMVNEPENRREELA
jgi:hypothetical protein